MADHAAAAMTALAAAETAPTGVHGKRGRYRKQRVLWDSDNATPGGKTSIGVLLEWLSAPGNYARWCGGGKSKDRAPSHGETREMLCSEINAAMRRHGIRHRENANIRTQISELERSFDNAVDWLVAHGCADGRLPTEASARSQEMETHVLRVCRYFHVLTGVMTPPTREARAHARRGVKRASMDGHTKTINLSSGNGGSMGANAVAPQERGGTDDHVFVLEDASRQRVDRIYATAAARAMAARDGMMAVPSRRGMTKRRAEEPMSATSTPTPTPTPTTTTTPTPTKAAASSLSQLHQTALASMAASGASSTFAAATPSAASASSAFASGPASALPPSRSPSRSSSPPPLQPPPPSMSVLRTTAMTPGNLSCFENTQRLIVEAAREDRERKRFQCEEQRHVLECEKLRLELQGQRIALAVQHALAQQQLLEMGMSVEDVARVLPAPLPLPQPSDQMRSLSEEARTHGAGQ